jgi:hypothetical protein
VRVASPPSARGPHQHRPARRPDRPRTVRVLRDLPVAGADPYGEDLQLALYLGYELHYRPMAGVDPELEWHPELLVLRRRLEDVFLAALRRDVEPGDDVEEALVPMLLVPVTGRGTSWHLGQSGTRQQLREYVAHRSIYHLKEADRRGGSCRAWRGPAKAAFAAVQSDEYGAGRADRMHAHLFAAILRDLDLDDSYGAYLDHAPATTLARSTHVDDRACAAPARRRAVARGVIEVTSSPARADVAAFAGSTRRPGGVLRRARGGRRRARAGAARPAARPARRSPELAADVVFGLRASLMLEDRFRRRRRRWEAGRSSLRRR